jgi:DNA-binding IclR family transcriptional regulator
LKPPRLIASRVCPGASPLDAHVREVFEQRYGIPILSQYGATEFAGIVACWTLADHARWVHAKKGSIGRARPGMRLRVVDPQTGLEITILGTRNGLNLQYIDIMQDERGQRLTHRSGSLRPLFRAAGGVAILSTYSDDFIGQLVRHYNAQQPAGAKLVRIERLLKTIETTRKQGYAMVVNQLKLGHGSIAMALPAEPADHRPLVVSVSAPVTRLRKRRELIVNAMRVAITASQKRNSQDVDQLLSA